MKIVVNKCYGGFSVSKDVYDELSIPWDGYGYISNDELGIDSENFTAYRADSRLIKAIEKVGLKKASGALADLVIVNIPNNIDWYIDDYDGIETIHEDHRSW
jgi:hypothetical protein